MAEKIAQSTAFRVAFKAFLSADHVSEATGKTIAITISKNGAAFANPSAGATNATEIASGWYYVDLSTTDTATLGPLIVRGTNADIDDMGVHYTVGPHEANVTHFGGTAGTFASGIPAVNTTQIEGSDATNQIRDSIVDDATRIDASALNTATGTTIPAIATDTAEIGAAGAGLTEAGGTGDHLTAVPWNAAWDAEVQSEVTDALNAYDPPTHAELVSEINAVQSDISGIDGKIDTVDGNVDAIKTKTDSLTFTVAGVLDGNIKRVNDVAVTGTGAPSDEWGPA